MSVIYASLLYLLLLFAFTFKTRAQAPTVI